MTELRELEVKLTELGAVSATMPVIDFERSWQIELLIANENAKLAALEAFEAGRIIAFDFVPAEYEDGDGEALRLLVDDAAVEPIRAAFDATLRRLSA